MRKAVLRQSAALLGWGTRTTALVIDRKTDIWSHSWKPSQPMVGVPADGERITRGVCPMFAAATEVTILVIPGPFWPVTTPHRPVTRQLSLIHISEPTRLGMISYAVFCLKKKK